MRGSGGYGISKFHLPYGHHHIDYDVVMKKNYDPSTFSLRVGCGQCGVSAPPVTNITYKRPVIEPFTQTPYFGLFDGVDRPTYDSSDLSSCPSPEFTVWIQDYGNRSNGDPLIWSAVVGRGESFTAGELFMFPGYILNNHGWWWNQLWFTYLLVVILLGVAFTVGTYIWPFHWSWADLRGVRERLYATACFFFVAASLEIIVHLFIAAGGSSYDGFGVGIAAVVVVGNLFPMAITIITWVAMYHPTWFITQQWWWPVELLSGFSYFFLFGSGFWISPMCIMAAAIVRACTRDNSMADVVGLKEVTETLL